MTDEPNPPVDIEAFSPKELENLKANPIPHQSLTYDLVVQERAMRCISRNLIKVMLESLKRLQTGQPIGLVILDICEPEPVGLLAVKEWDRACQAIGAQSVTAMRPLRSRDLHGSKIDGLEGEAVAGWSMIRLMADFAVVASPPQGPSPDASKEPPSRLA